MLNRRRALGVCALLLSVFITFVLAGCAATPSGPDDPAASVDALLRLRQERSTDASAYAQYLEPETAKDLARSSAEDTSGVTPTPAWEEPYVSAQDDSTAKVVVVWRSREEHPGFPAATEWSLKLADGHWIAIDAQAIEDTAGIPPRAP